MKVRSVCLMVLLQLLLTTGFAQSRPVDQLPATAVASPASEHRPLVLFISGDGGMKKFNVDMVNAFNNKGYAVVALNALRYFWKKKTPEEAGGDVAALLQYYSAQWKHQTFLLVGYSMGADVLPFIFNNLPPNLQDQTKQLVLMSPSRFTDMEVHVSEMLGKTMKNGMSVPEAINKITDHPLLLLFGEGERDFDLKELHISNYQHMVLPGGHHYDNEAGNVVQTIISHFQLQ
ncbi:AcvB/VirJ family lysyl-phosphatidylglycerol hydrolase [uncultured Chitinophaga sp.]|jgi:Type IV secretory pathway, VirJ component|uniref:AcvB/VirJ family lysyl-phosphatidylglycerol hydrolase n=1 Tax=uncultured Chitinophaga sp. TaxID=339340 RepID=UPI002639727D|nr:AcvB/VirJ family lysyl-phosphatidylglycerol hydrolase [uncultured Chitinophaga sp.]